MLNNSQAHYYHLTWLKKERYWLVEMTAGALESLQVFEASLWLSISCVWTIHTVYVTYSLYFWDMHVYFHHWSAHSAYLCRMPCLKKMQDKLLCECAHLRAHTHTYICLGNFPEIEPSYITAHTRASFRLFGGFLEDTEGLRPAVGPLPLRALFGGFFSCTLVRSQAVGSTWMKVKLTYIKRGTFLYFEIKPIWC